MAVVLRAGDVVTVDGVSGRRWRIAVPTRWTRYAWQRDREQRLAAAARELGVAGIRFAGREELHNLAREAAAALLASGPEQDEVLALVDASATAPEGPDGEAARTAFAGLEAELIAGWPPYRHAVEDRALWIEVGAETAVRRFVLGEVDAPDLPRDRDGLTDAGLAGVPVPDRLPLYVAVSDLLTQREAERGN